MKYEDEDGIIENVLVILPCGEVKKPNEVKDEDVQRVIKSELGLLKKEKEKPAHLKLMKKLEIAEEEPSVSDAGSIRWLPNGAFMCELFRRYAYIICVNEMGSYPVKTPMIVNPQDKAVNKMMSAFPERLYKVLPGIKDKKQEFRLRPACDYGVFSIFRDTKLSYKNLPLRLYEFEDASWRYEQRGELLGLKRTREFQMVDIHTMVEQGEPALKEFAYQMKVFGLRWYYELGLKPAGIVLNCMEGFFEENKNSFKEMSSYAGLPIIVKLFSKMKTYKVAWFDIIAFDVLNRPIEVDTVQLDTESPKWWGITYINKEGKEEYPYIIHTGIGTNRAIMTILECESTKERPVLPLWLAPIQLRIISVGEEFNEKALELCKKLNEKGVRCDVDERNERVGKKVMDASTHWINYILVFGEKEANSNKYEILNRETGEKKMYSIDEIVSEIKEKTKGKPYLPLFGPYEYSKRAKFIHWSE